MSTTATKRPHAIALRDAEAFRALFPADCYERWEIAGSIRRGKREIGDVEHVIIARQGEVKGDDLFAQPLAVNLLWHHLDALVKGGEVTKHIYGTTGFRWGSIYRGVDYRGFNHELFTTDRDGWGSTLAIRTGPAEYSKGLVIDLRRTGHRNVDGHVWRTQPCEKCAGQQPDPKCPWCKGDGMEPIEMVPAPDEETFFRLAGRAYVAPGRR